MQHPAAKVNAILTGSSGGSSMGISTQQVNIDHIFCIFQILFEQWEYNEAAHRLFIDFEKTYDSVRLELLCNILIEFGIAMKLVRLINCV